MWLIALAPAAEWTVELGADVTPSPHLVGTFAVREASWQAGLYTDTVDLRWTPSWEHGRGWVAALGAVLEQGLPTLRWLGARRSTSRSRRWVRRCRRSLQ